MATLGTVLDLLLKHLIKYHHLEICHNKASTYITIKLDGKYSEKVELQIYHINRIIPSLLRYDSHNLTDDNINEFRHKIPSNFMKYVATFDISSDL